MPPAAPHKGEGNTRDDRTVQTNGCPAPLTVLIDDAREFKDKRPSLVARSSQQALTLLHQLGDTRIDHLWLDHDLVGDDAIRPVVDRMVQLASTGTRLNVGQIHSHAANVGGGHWIRIQLEAAGYPVARNFASGMWTHQWPPIRTAVDGADP